MATLSKSLYALHLFLCCSGEPYPSPCMFYTCFHVVVENLIQVPVCSTLVSIFQWRTLSKSLYVLHLFPCYSGEPCPSPCMFYTCFHLSVENFVQVPVCSTLVSMLQWRTLSKSLYVLHLFPCCSGEPCPSPCMFYTCFHVVVENLVQVPVCSTLVSMLQWRTLSKSLYVLHLFPSQWRTLSKSLYALHLFPCCSGEPYPSPCMFYTCFHVVVENLIQVPVCSTLVSMLSVENLIQVPVCSTLVSML